MTSMEGEKWRRATVQASQIRSLHECIRHCFDLDNLGDDASDVAQIVTNSGESFVFVQSVITLLTSISDYCKLADQIPQVQQI